MSKVLGENDNKWWKTLWAVASKSHSHWLWWPVSNMTPSDTHHLVFSYCVVSYHMIPELACVTHRLGQKQSKWWWLLSWICSLSLALFLFFLDHFLLRKPCERRQRRGPCADELKSLAKSYRFELGSWSFSLLLR